MCKITSTDRTRKDMVWRRVGEEVGLGGKYCLGHFTFLKVLLSEDPAGFTPIYFMYPGTPASGVFLASTTETKL